MIAGYKIIREKFYMARYEAKKLVRMYLILNDECEFLVL